MRICQKSRRILVDFFALPNFFWARNFQNCTHVITPASWHVDWKKNREDTPTSPEVTRPPVYGSNGRTYKMLVMFFFLFFISPRVLRVPSTDRHETLPPGRNLCVFYNASPKIRGGTPPKKLGGQKHAKFRPILDHFRVWSRISPERLKIYTRKFSKADKPAR